VDGVLGIITSANLTNGGLFGNFEYGILLDDRHQVSVMRDDMLQYHSLGNMLDKTLLKKISRETQKIQATDQKIRAYVKHPRLARLLQSKTKDLQHELLKNRIRGGRTVSAIFAETILYLLRTEGALSTESLHPLIQGVHPDICDDTIDRVIAGQHFGKRWKHLVRGAQQQLKAGGLIVLQDDGRWSLSTE
jgi:hypothetical protein